MEIGPWGSLLDALGLGPRELVAVVGAGGKTSTLRLVAADLAAQGATVIATTTTAMYARELAALGPLVLEADPGQAQVRLGEALARSRVVGVATAGELPDGKVRGLSRSALDALWRASLADYVVVEADGSRGLPLKAWGPDEPAVPTTATTVVVVAGLGAIGRTLTDAHVHRAGRMAEALGVALGSEVSPEIFAEAVRLQLSALTAGGPRWRVVALLNGVDSPAVERLGRSLAGRLLELGEEPSAVILGCLREGRAARAEVVAA